MSSGTKKMVYLIGRFNDITQDIDQFLGQYYDVQLCSDNLNLLRSMLRKKRPEVFLISLMGMNKWQLNIFSEIRVYHSEIPVICIGTEDEQDPFESYLKQKQFHVLEQPVDNIKLLAMIQELTDDWRKAGTAETEQSDMQPVPELKAPVFSSGKKRILIVDDNAMQLRTLKGILQEKYNVSMATSGTDAIRELKRRPPDLIFLDYEMPVCDGKQTLEMIRDLEDARDIPVVFLTGVNDKEHIRAVLTLKPAGYILKPASQERILSTAAEILGN